MLADEAARPGRRRTAAQAALLGGLIVALAAYVGGWPRPAVALEVEPVRVAVTGDRLEVTVRARPGTANEIRAWFFLADLDEAAPWFRYTYVSPVLEQQVVPGKDTTFRWDVDTGVPPGVYGLTIWFHHYDYESGRWEHLTGGAHGIPPVRITAGD